MVRAHVRYSLCVNILADAATEKRKKKRAKVGIYCNRAN